MTGSPTGSGSRTSEAGAGPRTGEAGGGPLAGGTGPAGPPVRGYGPEAAHCSRCAARLPGPLPCACVACGYRLFLNARPTVGLIVLDGTRFLAVRRAAEPRAGLWELPGGFCDGWEHPADAAIREAREELGAQISLGPFVGMYVGSYDYQGERIPVLDTFYLASLAGRVTLNPAEASEMTWFDLAKPPPLAFDTMDRAVVDAARQLRR